MSYQTFLFDFDYTLADSSAGIVRCFRAVLDQHGFIQPTDTDIKRTIGKTLEESFEILTQITDSNRLAQFRKEYVQHADLYMNSNTHLYEGTERMLRQLKDNGCQIGIISTKYRYRIADFLRTKGIYELFDLIIGGEDVEKPKPNPEGIWKAIQSLQADQQHTVYVGDSCVDAEAARNANVSFIGVTNGMTSRKELSAYPNVTITDNLHELTRFTENSSNQNESNNKINILHR